jgi:hypothetical protein
MRRSARLRWVMSRITKIVPWKPGSVLEIADAVTAGFEQDLLRAETCAVFVRDQRCELDSDQLSGLVSEQSCRGEVLGANAAVGCRDQDRVAHAVEQGVEVVARNRRSGQGRAHLLERRGQGSHFFGTGFRHGFPIRAVADAVGAGHQDLHCLIDPGHAPGQQPRRDCRQPQADAAGDPDAQHMGAGDALCHLMLQVRKRGNRVGRTVRTDRCDEGVELTQLVQGPEPREQRNHGRERDAQQRDDEQVTMVNPHCFRQPPTIRAAAPGPRVA